MRPLAELARERDAVRALEGVLFDLDDTLLSHGVLTREAYGALWDLRDAGLRLVAVTGRPSAWGEVLARQWPIEGAVTENGAAHVVREEKGVSVRLDPSIPRRRERLDAIVDELARDFPAVRLADDAHARRTDVTWDIGERDRVPREIVDAMAAAIVARGARTTRSSVHLHATFDRDDKASGVVRFLGGDAGATLHRFAYVGDSGNDAACFAAFRMTFGVANVRPWVPTFSVPPRYVALEERGAGFVAIARAILALR